jgi:hypothetical protein
MPKRRIVAIIGEIARRDLNNLSKLDVNFVLFSLSFKRLRKHSKMGESGGAYIRNLHLMW